ESRPQWDCVILCIVVHGVVGSGVAGDMLASLLKYQKNPKCTAMGAGGWRHTAAGVAFALGLAGCAGAEAPTMPPPTLASMDVAGIAPSGQGTATPPATPVREPTP